MSEPDRIALQAGCLAMAELSEGAGLHRGVWERAAKSLNDREGAPEPSPNEEGRVISLPFWGEES